jgi:hypothetical protein
MDTYVCMSPKNQGGGVVRGGRINAFLISAPTAPSCGIVGLENMSFSMLSVCQGMLHTHTHTHTHLQVCVCVYVYHGIAAN